MFGKLWLIVVTLVGLMAIHNIQLVASVNAPVFAIQPRDFSGASAISLAHDNGLTLPCRADGPGPISYFWQRDGNTIQVDQRIQLRGGNLSFTGVIKSDESNSYQCFATNQYGTSVSRQAILQVRFTPLSDQAQNKFTTPNASSYLDCFIPPSTTPRPSAIFWTDRRSRRVAESNRIAISITTGNIYFVYASPNDTSDLQCNTQFPLSQPNSNTISSTRITGSWQSLNVTGTPVSSEAVNIAEGPINQLVDRGGNVTFQCIATGFPIPTIQWQKVGGPLPFGRYRFNNWGRQLILTNVRSEDSGNYSCTVMNGGTPKTKMARLEIHIDPSWELPITDTAQPILSDFLWPCRAGGSEVQYRWYRNGITIANSGKYSLYSNGSLLIRALGQSDRAVYTCLAFNTHNNLVSTGWLNITASRPYFIYMPLSQTILFRGSSSVFRCTVDGGPRPSMSYQKDSVELNTAISNKYTVLLNGNLIIHNVNDSDAGLYRCIATNSRGSIEASGTAVVRNSTLFTASLMTRSIRRPNPFTLACNATKDSGLNAELYWTINNANITNSRIIINTVGLDSTLRFVNSTLADSGSYACVIATYVPNVGFDRKISSATITINDIPDPPFNVTSRNETKSSMYISWLPGNSNNSPLKHFIIRYLVNSVNDWRDADNDVPISATYRGIQLSPWNAYQIVVAAVNGVGMSRNSASINYRTDADVPYRVVGSVRFYGISNDNAAIQIVWIPLSRQYHNGPGIGYRLYYRVQGSATGWVSRPIGTTGSFRLSQLLPNVRYEFQLVPYNNIGEGRVRTPIASVFTGTVPPSAAPTNLKAYLIAPDRVFLVWNKVNAPSSSAVGYRVSHWIYDNSIASTNVFGDVNEVSISNLDRLTNYTFRVNAYAEGGDGPYSNSVWCYTGQPVPTRVGNIIVTEPIRGQVRLRWSTPTTTNGRIVHYKVDYAMIDVEGNVGSTVSNHTIGSEVNFNYYNMQTGVYRFTITPRNSNGYGIPRAIQANVQGNGPQAPINLRLVGTTRITSVTLAWDVIEIPLDGFIIQYRLSTSTSGHENITTLLSPNLRERVVIGLTADTSYEFHIVARSRNAYSLPSNAVQAKTQAETERQVTPFYQEPWFIGLVAAVGGLILILIIIFLVRSVYKKKAKGGRKGHYPLHHQEHRINIPEDGKPEIPPPPTEDQDDIPIKRPPLPHDTTYASNEFRQADLDRESLDSMDEYADLPGLSKFNEDGSFIGEYGDSRYDSRSQYNSSNHLNSSTLPRNSRPASPASTINPNNSAFSTFV